MGLMAGVLVLRHPRQDGGDEEEGTKGAGAGTGMPWPSHVLGLPLPFAGAGAGCRWPTPPQSAAEWSATATRHALGLFVLTVGGAVWDALLRAAHGPELYVNMWWMALVPFSHLTLVVGLTRCCAGPGAAAPLVYQALATPFAQWLGKVSLGVYLVHEPLIDWLAVLTAARSSSSPPDYMQQLWACAGAGRRTGTCDPDCALLAYAGKFLPKTWGIAVVVSLALALGELLYRCVEEPARRRLRWKGPGGRGGGG